MSKTLDRMVADMRRVWLDEPLPNLPNHAYLFTQLVPVIQSALNQIANTGQNWETREAEFVVSYGDEEIQLPNVNNLGKPLSIYTADPNDAQHRERDIPIIKLQNLTQTIEGPRDGMGWGFIGSDTHPATAFAVYRRQNAWYVRPRPLTPPGASAATYKLVYAVGDWSLEAQRHSATVLEQFSGLFEMRAAINALSRACWWDESTDEGFKRNQAKRKEIANLRAPEIERQQVIFDQYVTSLNGRKVTFKGSNCDEW